jgi:DNA-binding PucR family transcriptional regulator
VPVETRKLRRLQQLFGDQLADSESRFELEIALRARALLDPPL